MSFNTTTSSNSRYIHHFLVTTEINLVSSRLGEKWEAVSRHLRYGWFTLSNLSWMVGLADRRPALSHRGRGICPAAHGFHTCAKVRASLLAAIAASPSRQWQARHGRCCSRLTRSGLQVPVKHGSLIRSPQLRFDIVEHARGSRPNNPKVRRRPCRGGEPCLWKSMPPSVGTT